VKIWCGIKKMDSDRISSRSIRTLPWEASPADCSPIANSTITTHCDWDQRLKENETERGTEKIAEEDA
jgi:hypothetical protein